MNALTKFIANYKLGTIGGLLIGILVYLIYSYGGSFSFAEQAILDTGRSVSLDDLSGVAKQYAMFAFIFIGIIGGIIAQHFGEKRKNHAVLFWIVGIMIAGYLINGAMETDTARGAFLPKTLSGFAGGIPKVIGALWSIVWFVFGLMFLFGGSGSGLGIPIWVFYILGFVVLALLLKKKKQPVVYQ